MSTWSIDPPPFVVVEGLDGAGTTTQVERLVERLRQSNRPATSTREPSDGPIGALLRQMLSKRVVAPSGDDGVEPIDDDALALMFAADRIDHLRAEIEPALDAGRAVVSDRYYPSNFAYQGDVEGDDVRFDWIETLNQRARTPDLIVFLEASADLCLERLAERGRRDIYEHRRQLERLEHAYDHVFDRLEDDGPPVLRCDASRSRDALTDTITEAVLALDSPSRSDDPS
jgi:dTMP kinase